jgi:hypothetical protein
VVRPRVDEEQVHVTVADHLIGDVDISAARVLGPGLPVHGPDRNWRARAQAVNQGRFTDTITASASGGLRRNVQILPAAAVPVETDLSRSCLVVAVVDRAHAALGEIVRAMPTPGLTCSSGQIGPRTPVERVGSLTASCNWIRLRFARSPAAR